MAVAERAKIDERTQYLRCYTTFDYRAMCKQEKDQDVAAINANSPCNTKCVIIGHPRGTGGPAPHTIKGAPPIRDT